MGELSPSSAWRTILIGGKPCWRKSSWNSSSVKAAPSFAFTSVAQLHDLELAQRVVEIGRVAGAALGLDLADFAATGSLPSRRSRSPWSDGHLAGVHLDADDVACIAQQRVLQLAEATASPRAVVRPARLAVALIEHHLFAVMRPALGVGVGAEQLADRRRAPVASRGTARSGRGRPRGPRCG